MLFVRKKTCWASIKNISTQMTIMSARSLKIPVMERSKTVVHLQDANL